MYINYLIIFGTIALASLAETCLDAGDDLVEEVQSERAADFEEVVVIAFIVSVPFFRLLAVAVIAF